MTQNYTVTGAVAPATASTLNPDEGTILVWYDDEVLIAEPRESDDG